MGELLLAIDQGTTSSRAILYDRKGCQVARFDAPLQNYYPADGHVEQDPAEILASVISVGEQAVAHGGGAIAAIGITNQRETTLVWDRATGRAIHRAVVWQDRRTAQECARLRAVGGEDVVRQRSGLLLDPYFSATKVAWILDHVEGARTRAEAGELAFGTVDSWLLWHLTEGRVHGTDATNASRTMLYDIHRGCWDEALLAFFKVPHQVLPQVRDCAGDFGVTSVWGPELPIRGVAGDQQAALIGQACFEAGMVKSTYGTGCFVMANTGESALASDHRLLTTLAWQLDGRRTYALEGSIFMAGAAVQWLRDGLQLIETAAESEVVATSLPDSDQVYMVPAFAGLGAPYWDPDARGAVLGLTQDTGLAHVVRATLDAVAYQTRDLLEAMAKDGVPVSQLRVDGGMVANNWLMQRLADVTGLPIVRPQITETTAFGAAVLAGLGCGWFDSLQDVAGFWRLNRDWQPLMASDQRDRLYAGWQRAVDRVRSR